MNLAQQISAPTDETFSQAGLTSRLLWEKYQSTFDNHKQLPNDEYSEEVGRMYTDWLTFQELHPPDLDDEAKKEVAEVRAMWSIEK